MRLQNAPLVHVLAQVVFPAIPKWEAKIEDVRERFADLGFPRGNRYETHELAIAINPAEGAPAQKPVTRVHWEFGDKGQRTGFVFSDTMLVLQTSAYSSHEEFLKTIERGIETLVTIYKAKIVDRLGLRYINLVQLRQGEHFDEYVHKGLLGFPFNDAHDLHASGRGFATQSIAETPEGLLAVRSGLVPLGQYLPPDLGIVRLLPPERFDPKQIGLIVDFDHFTSFVGPSARAMDFDSSIIASHFLGLHARIKKAFETIIEQHARDVWTTNPVSNAALSTTSSVTVTEEG